MPAPVAPARPKIAVPLALAGALVAAAVGIELTRERLVPEPPAVLPTLWMRSPAVMDRLSLEFDALAADVYWIRAVVYYGGVRRSDDVLKNYDLLHPLLDLTTTLDPRFLLAYRMGAIFLSEAYPGGAGRPDLAIDLLEKGVRANPMRWELLHDIGFVYFWSYRDYVTAASWIERAANVPGSPSWLRPVVAGMLARGGERSTARLLWTEMLRSDERGMQEVARLRLVQLDAMDQIDALHSLVARVTLATGVRPASWSDLIARGWLRSVPVDPSGTPYVMDPFTSRVTVSRESALYPMPDQLNAAQ
jgi:hypothetical protein